GDIVLDPFGGSGVTAIEALMNNRKAINIDLNPLAIFLVEALGAPVNITELGLAYERIKRIYVANEPQTVEEIRTCIKKYGYPKTKILERGSDAKTVDQLFSKKQLAQLGFLKHL